MKPNYMPMLIGTVLLLIVVFLIIILIINLSEKKHRKKVKKESEFLASISQLQSDIATQKEQREKLQKILVKCSDEHPVSRIRTRL